MECTTIDKIIEDGVAVTRPKKQFDSLDAAIAVAKIENSKDEHEHKVVAYKCGVCFKYHVGRNGKPLTDKEREKCKREVGLQNQEREYHKAHPYSRIKVVGYIDLSKIKY